MLCKELLEIVSNHENSGVEFKRDDIRPEQLAKEVVALANLQGGRIFLGVEDDGTISGIQKDNTQEWVLNVLRDKVHPQLIPFYEEIRLADGRTVAVVSIASGLSKPYSVRHNNREDVYIRMGDRSELASREQQLRLFESGGLLHVETLPVPGAGSDQLDMDRISFYLEHIIQDPEIPETEQEWTERLYGMGLMAEDGLGNKVCSLAGLVCFGIAPRRYLKQAGIRVMSFRGLDKEYQAQLDEVLDGPMVARWKITKAGRNLVDNGLIEKLSAMIGPFISQESSEIDEHMRREKKCFFPWPAVRETLVNALIHRDWTRSVDIEVCNYSDRLEIISPGKLRNTMTVEKMIAGQRSPRNPLIVEILRDFSYVDARGMGIRTKVIPLMKSHNGVDPVFEATDDYLKVILPRQAEA
ncbi:MAG: transcriptional regulator [Desulfobacteraceae bacterium 4572_88]|nr:MAG: transcriptional regulator [Desulfobacteraceae bacterium 4572_88]